MVEVGRDLWRSSGSTLAQEDTREIMILSLYVYLYTHIFLQRFSVKSTYILSCVQISGILPLELAIIFCLEILGQLPRMKKVKLKMIIKNTSCWE